MTEAAGWGDALEIVAEVEEDISSALQKVDSLIQEHPHRANLCLFGGGRFNFGEEPGDVWRGFPALRFVQPRVTLLRTGGRYQLIYCCPGTENQTAEAEHFERLLGEFHSFHQEQGAPTLPSILSRQDLPDVAGWELMMSRALQTFQEGTLQKVVLARQTDLELEEPLSPFDFIRSIQQVKQECYSFIISPKGERAFVSASPERLFRWVESFLESDALGSTIERSKDREKDAELCQKLLEDSKSASEHDFISKDILEKFRLLAEKVDRCGAPRIVTLADVHHLLTPIAGTLKEGVTRGQVLRTLHPSPAVGGTPTKEALEFILGEEPFDRGWYAGPVGLITAEYTEFCVALRSLIIDEARVHLFTGAGIVEQSDPHAELEEIENKMSTALKLFKGSEQFKRSYV